MDKLRRYYVADNESQLIKSQDRIETENVERFDFVDSRGVLYFMNGEVYRYAYPVSDVETLSWADRDTLMNLLGRYIRRLDGKTFYVEGAYIALDDLSYLQTRDRRTNEILKPTVIDLIENYRRGDPEADNLIASVANEFSVASYEYNYRTRVLKKLPF